MPETQKNVEIIECENWNDFRNRVVNDHSIDGIFQKGVFLFRGQAYESWKLDTTFDRMYKGYKKSEKNARADELLSEFIYECEYDDILENLRTDRLYMLALGQHNGLPTRLLDWSESPFVASLFAYSAHVYKGYKAEERVAVWSLDTRNKAWSEGCGCQIVRIVATGNERIRNQQGRFTYLRTPDENLESYVDKFGDGEVCLRKYTMPIKDIKFAMSELEAMGLSHSRIYPGISGNAYAAQVRFSLRDILGIRDTDIMTEVEEGNLLGDQEQGKK